MKKIWAIFLFLLIATVSFTETKIEDKTIYKDIKKDHWAYKAVENLVYKGIITVDSNFFNGEDSITRYDMAYYLSRVVNKLDDEKAGRDDLMVVEKLVEEFSKEMNSYGMDIGQYINKIKILEEKASKNESEIKKIRENEIKLLKDEIAQLKEYKNVNNKESENSVINIKRLNKDGYNLKITTEFANYDPENIDFSKNHILELEVSGTNFSGKIVQEDEEKLKLQVEGTTDIVSNLSLNFHTLGYNRWYYSFYNNIYYENKSSSSGITISLNDLKKIGFSEFKISAEQEKLGKLKLINNISWTYLDIMGIYSGEDKKYKYEAVGKVSFLNNYIANVGYSHSEPITYLNGSITYDNKDIIKTSIGYEKAEQKEEQEQLYNRFYGKIKYDLLKDVKLNVDYDFYDVIGGKYQNYEVSFRNKFYNLSSLISYKINQIEKNEVNKIADILDLKSEEKQYREILAKATYNIDKISLNIGYINKILNDFQVYLSFIGLEYKIKEETKVYIKFLKTTDDYEDDKRDMDNMKYDIDFSEKNIMISKNEYEKGKITLGLEMNF